MLTMNLSNRCRALQGTPYTSWTLMHYRMLTTLYSWAKAL